MSTIAAGALEAGLPAQRIYRAYTDADVLRFLDELLQDVVRLAGLAALPHQGLAVGMARQVLRCQEKKADCPVPATAIRPKQLYCSSWGVGTALCKAG